MMKIVLVMLLTVAGVYAQAPQGTLAVVVHTESGQPVSQVEVQAGEEGIRFLLVSGKPLQEPVAWYGPIVMNTQEQLQQAFLELKNGTFLKSQ